VRRRLVRAALLALAIAAAWPGAASAKLAEPAALPEGLSEPARALLAARRVELQETREAIVREIREQNGECAKVDADDREKEQRCVEWSGRLRKRCDDYLAAVADFGRDVECGRMSARRERLAAGLPVQEEAIRRTEAQLEAAARSVAEASAEKRALLMKAALDEAKGYAADVLTSAEALRGQIRLLKDLGMKPADRDLLIRTLDTAVFEGEGLLEAARAGKEGGDLLRGRVDELAGKILPLADRLLLQSGLAEKVGEELAGKVWGPPGELAFRGARLSIDFTVAVGQGRIGEAERAAAQRNLGIMREQLQRVRRRIADLDAAIAKGCGKP
jgi:hypothetical protein